MQTLPIIHTTQGSNCTAQIASYRCAQFLQFKSSELCLHRIGGMIKDARNPSEYDSTVLSHALTGLVASSVDRSNSCDPNNVDLYRLYGIRGRTSSDATIILIIHAAFLPLPHRWSGHSTKAYHPHSTEL